MVRSIEMVEVGPRDGLQNEKVLVTTADKVKFIRRAIGAGVKRLEIASFVNPRLVPQMADAEAVVKELGEIDGVTRIGLTLNKRGALRALECGIDQFGAVCMATDGFGLKNQNATSAQTVDIAKDIIKLAQTEGRTAQATISAAFGCPFEGEVPPRRIVEMAEELAQAGPVEIALADTIGVAVPSQVSELVAQVREVIAPIPVRVHFHNTRNTAIANVWAAVQAGASIIDASIGGIGGCPFAPTATGNVATEDVLYLLSRSNIRHGLDFDEVIKTAKWLETILDKKMPSMLSAAGSFPINQDENCYDK